MQGTLYQGDIIVIYFQKEGEGFYLLEEVGQIEMGSPRQCPMRITNCIRVIDTDDLYFDEQGGLKYEAGSRYEKNSTKETK